MSQGEKQPLLSTQTDLPTDDYQAASARLEGEYVNGVVELGPPDASEGGVEGSEAGRIPCRVCGAVLDVVDRADQHVVKCTECMEATPVRTAPPGKKYVRCPCNCLLICRTSSQRIACPRAACKRVINLPVSNSGGASGTGGAQQSARQPLSQLPTVPGMCRVTCCYCRDSFLFNCLTNALARCPHCRKVSSVGGRYARSRGSGFLLAAFIVFALALGITLGTYRYAQHKQGIYIVYVGGFLSALVLFLRAIYYFTLRISHSDRSVD